MEIYEDVWVSTVCGRCYCGCGIRVRRVNGVAVKIEGVPDSDQGGRGGLCAKGESGLQWLYDPNRLNVPLRRTNPEKGLHVDPKWEEISWDEALDEIATKLKKVLDDDPGKLLGSTCYVRSGGSSSGGGMGYRAFPGTLHWGGGGGLHCGGGSHNAAGLISGTWSIVPDFELCNYAIYFGATKGTGAGHSAMVTARRAAEARARGMKMVVFDPICNYPGAKATEWVPVMPGTDGAVALAMCNIIVNELGIFDKQYIATKTNGPYLIGPDGKYIREELISEEAARLKETRVKEIEERTSKAMQVIAVTESNLIGGTSKPLVWDAIDAKAKPYDDPTIKEFALEGEFEVAGIKCRPAWQLVKEDLKKYTAEMASKVSTVPAETIHRIATEFAREARVGSTITLDGHVLPFRPASAIIFRGGSGHTNSLHSCLAIMLLNQIVGNCDVPGGTLGWPARGLGYPGTGKMKYEPFAGVDGLLETDGFGPYTSMHGPWPKFYPQETGNLRLQDIFPMWHPQSPYPMTSDAEEIWQKLGIDHRIEMIISWGNNTVLNTGNWAAIEDFLKKVPFTVIFENFNNEFTEGFADIVLPDTCYLEEESMSGTGFNFNYPFGMEDWCFHITQPVVKPQYSRRPSYQVWRELYDRVGVKPGIDLGAGGFFVNELYEEYQPGAKGKLSEVKEEDIIDRCLKKLFGAEHDWEWFKKNGFIRWQKKVEEAYWRYFVDARTMIYMEFMVDLKEAEEAICSKRGIGFDLSQYTPFVSWFPCPFHEEHQPEYDLICHTYRDALHSGGHTHEQPWLDEASRMNPYTYNVTMNADTAKKKGLKDGDTIEIESDAGRKVTGTLKVMEGQHPQMVGIAACSGHWAMGMPIARGKGTNFDNLLELDLKHTDPISGNLETCARVKVRKVEER